jgi:hypothetical protein
MLPSGCDASGEPENVGASVVTSITVKSLVSTPPEIAMRPAGQVTANVAQVAVGATVTRLVTVVSAGHLRPGACAGRKQKTENETG